MVTVATYNVLHGLHLGRAGRLDLAAAATVIEALRADVIALQEVDRHLERTDRVDQVAWLADALGYEGVFAPALIGDPERSWSAPRDPDPGGPAYGIGILSRLPIIASARHRLPGGGDGQRRRPARPSRPGWDREPRIALTCTVTAAWGTLVATTSHLSYLPWRGLAQLRAVARTADGPTPAVLLGDLNLPPLAVKLALPGWDYHPATPTYPSARPRVQVDHVLTRGLRSRGARVGTATTSDHLPLVASLATA